MNIWGNYGVTIYTVLLTVVLLVVMQLNRSKEDRRFLLLRSGVFLLLLNLIADLFRVGFTAGYLQWHYWAISLVLEVYFVAEVLLLLMTSYYLMVLIPSVWRKRKTHQKVSAVVGIILLLASLTNYWTGFICRDGNRTDEQVCYGSGFGLIFGCALFFMIFYIVFLQFHKREISKKVLLNLEFIAITALIIYLSRFAFHDMRVLDVACICIFYLCYFLFHANRYAPETGRMSSEMYKGELGHLLRQKKNMMVYEIKILNYNQLAHSLQYSEPEMDLFFDQLSCELQLEWDNLLIYQKRRKVLGVIALGQNAEQAEVFAGILEEKLKAGRGSLFSFAIAGSSLKGFDDVAETDRYFFDLIEKCPENHYYFGTEDDEKEFKVRREMIKLLREIHWQPQDLVLFIQPILNTQTMKLDSFEVLERMQLPGAGILKAKKFSGLAERYGFAHDISMATLKKTCQYIEQMDLKEHTDVRFSLNLNSNELLQPGFANDMLEILNEHGVAGNRILFEVTLQHQEAAELAIIRDNMNKLIERQIDFVYDHFSMMSVNLEIISELPFKTIKYDHYSIEKAVTEPGAFEIVEALSDMLKSRGYKILFCGIEDDQQEEIAVSLEAEYVQGYKYARPCPIEEIDNLINEDRMF